MIDVKEAEPGDVIYFKVPWMKRPLFGEILKIYENENAVQVMSQNDGYRVVWAYNAFWDEKIAKKADYRKYVKGQDTYLQNDNAEVPDEKPDDGKRPVHNRKKKETKDNGPSKAGKSVRRRVKRKSQIVRKPRK
tara:strand:- start:301 stop:702 length:402 start_codon:yes stop_codon:yes gene_type:complete